MRDGPTTQPARIAGHPCAHLAAARPDAGRESTPLGRSNGRAIHPSLDAFLCHFRWSYTVQNVISRTSAPATLRLTPTFAAASHQNATAALRSNDTRLPSLPRRRKGAQAKGRAATDHGPLIYGTGIKKLRKPTPINEYKLLIYGKPCPQRVPLPTAAATAPNPNRNSVAIRNSLK